jgi:hypothetical protein
MSVKTILRWALVLALGTLFIYAGGTCPAHAAAALSLSLSARSWPGLPSDKPQGQRKQYARSTEEAQCMPVAWLLGGALVVVLRTCLSAPLSSAQLTVLALCSLVPARSNSGQGIQLRAACKACRYDKELLMQLRGFIAALHFSWPCSVHRESCGPSLLLVLFACF